MKAAAAWAALALATAAAAAPDGAPHSGAPAPAPALDHPCYTAPTNASCAAFVRPAGAWRGDLERLCAAMDYMPGCTLARECTVRALRGMVVAGGSDSARGDDPGRPPLSPPPFQARDDAAGFCSHPSLVATVCEDMPKMKGCEAARALCVNGSAVPACAVGALPGAPSTAAAEAAVRAMCDTHSMPGCGGCRGAAGTGDCKDPLLSLAQVCSSMPGMRDCAPLAAACGAAGAAASFPSACALVAGRPGTAATKAAKPTPAASFTLPPMRMWLHADAEDAVLARQWVPRSPGSVAAACLGAAGGAAGAQALRAGRALLEARWAGSLAAGKGYGFGARAARNGVRALFTSAIALADLLLMLVAMTFSWPLIASVAGGYGVGAALFGHIGERGAPGGPPARRQRVAPGDDVSTNEDVPAEGKLSLGGAGGGCCDLGGQGQGCKPGV
jgi:copper transporter 1